MASVLIFDSGVGGLSILNSVQKVLPNANYHYLADYAAYPYGNKEEQWLIERVDYLIRLLSPTINPDIIVIACNTASTLALPRLRSHLNIPVVGVVPAIKTAAQTTKNKRIGLLATPGTIARPYMDILIKDFASHCHVVRVGSTELVHMAESKLKGTDVQQSHLKEIICPFVDAAVDTVVLGCTHFPLIKPELEKISRHISWIDSGEAIARRVHQLIQGKNINDYSGKKTWVYSTTPVDAILKKQFSTLACHGFHYLDARLTQD